MKIFGSIILYLSFTMNVYATYLYDCSSARPEKPGLHNMILFGKPNDELYVYHLPLFAGKTNGTEGHVLMHVYQAVWNIKIDHATKNAYDVMFNNKIKTSKSFPFFMISPKTRFRIPEIICESNFKFSAKTVYGHIENNNTYPAPISLTDNLSIVRIKNEAIFAKRFNGASTKKLTYFIFGTPKQYYMVHLLTDDENSYDHIIAIKVLDENIMKMVNKNKIIYITIANSNKTPLNLVSENNHEKRANNKWKLPTNKPGSIFDVYEHETSNKFKIKIDAEIYFNNNDDLKK